MPRGPRPPPSRLPCGCYRIRSGGRGSKADQVDGWLGAGLAAAAGCRLLFGAQSLGGALLHHEVAGERVLMTTAESLAAFEETNPSLMKKLSLLWQFELVEPITCYPSNMMTEIYGAYSNNHRRHTHTCTKLNVWGLDRYDKILYLDADTLVLDDVSWVFTWPSAFAAAADPCLSYMLNTGVMLLEPSLDTLAELKALNAAEGSFDNGDQGLVNVWFGARWYGSRPEGVPVGTLPPYMNTPTSSVGTISSRYASVVGERLARSGLRRGMMRPPQVLHFMGGAKAEKPWSVAAFEAFGAKDRPHPTWGSTWGPDHPSWAHHKAWQRAFSRSEIYVNAILKEEEDGEGAGAGEGAEDGGGGAGVGSPSPARGSEEL